MVEALGPFPSRLLEKAKDGRLRRVAEEAADSADVPQLGAWTGLAGAGTPEARCLDLLKRLLALDPSDRITAAEALQHPFFTTEEPQAPKRPKGIQLRTLGGSDAKLANSMDGKA